MLETDLERMVYAYELREAGFKKSCADRRYMVRIDGDVVHQFVKVAKGVYSYDGQSPVKDHPLLEEFMRRTQVEMG